jgi:hypothetical protein
VKPFKDHRNLQAALNRTLMRQVHPLNCALSQGMLRHVHAHTHLAARLLPLTLSEPLVMTTDVGPRCAVQALSFDLGVHLSLNYLYDCSSLETEPTALPGLVPALVLTMVHPGAHGSTQQQEADRQATRHLQDAWGSRHARLSLQRRVCRCHCCRWSCRGGPLCGCSPQTFRAPSGSALH